MKKQKITVNEAAAIMGKDPTFVRLCLQDGTFPFGVAHKREGSSKWSYYISPKLFYEYVGRENKDEEKN